MFPLEILHDFLLHGFRLPGVPARFTVSKENFESPVVRANPRKGFPRAMASQGPAIQIK